MPSAPSLGPLTRLPKENAHAVFDVETKPAYKGEPINTAWLGAAVYRGSGDPRVFVNKDAFFECLLGPEFERHWIYAHNGSGFDFHFLLEYLCCHRIKWRAYRTGQRLFVQVENREFFDSMAILRGSLADVCDVLQVPTRKWKTSPDFYATIVRQDWQGYLKDDCRALRQCVEVCRESVRKLGAILRPTLASTAMTLWRAKYLDCKIKVLGPFAPEPEEWRKAYFGGRVEVFRREMGPGGSWDVNSSFPAAMLEPQPCDYLGAIAADTIPDGPAIVLADVDVPTSELHPPLCIPGTDGRLWFPTGPRRGWFCSDELRYCATRYGSGSVRPISAHLFKPRDIFSSYVHALYREKQSAKGPVAFNAKLLLNSLYGKTGMRREREKIVCGPEFYDWPWNDPKALRRFRANGQTPSKRVLSHADYLYAIPDRANFATYILPQIAATVTARARIRLQCLLDRSDDFACYCDTDSVYGDGPRNTLAEFEGQKIGQVKYEGAINRAIFAAPKVYYLETPDGPKGKAKGLRRSNAADVLRFIQGEEISVRRVLGIFETRRRNAGKQILQSENTTKRAIRLEIRRHPDGRAFTVDELQALAIIG